jgi:tape measure domain-containing protein
VSANELSLTFLLKMDGGQAVSAEFQRLTAQISSQLAGLNKPNDSAAAAAIGVLKEQAQTAKAIQKEVSQSAVSTESEKNKQIEAMWVQRQAQTAAALTKESQITAAFASQEAQATRVAQGQIVSAHQQRERQVETLAKQEADAWAKHESGKVSTTRQAEKQGEAIVAQANAAKEQSDKKAETKRRQQTKEALRDIERLERERVQIATQNEKAIEALAKREADARIREAKRAANGFVETLRQMQREQARLTASLTQRASGGTNTLLAGAAGGIAALVGVSAVNEIRQAGAAWVDYSSKLENTRIAFTTMLGSAQLAEEHLKELQQFALKTPFQFSELIDASQRMQALGFNAQQVIPILNDVGNAVAGAGGGSERLDRVVLALSQIQSKGKVATQELNQLAESGIPAFRILQETLGKSGAAVRKLVEDGQISSKVFLDAFQKFSQQNFGGLMEKQSRTFTGAMSNIKDALLITSATAFEPLYAKLAKLALSFSEAATSSQDFQSKLKTVGEFSSTTFDGLVEVIIAFRDAVRLAVVAISAQFELLTGSLQAVSHALAAAFFESLALGRVLRGDLAGAARAHEEAQNQLRISAEGAKKAFESQGKIVLELSRIYGEAEKRAKALKDAQQNVGADVGGGAGIFRKKRPDDTDDDLTKKTKGADPAITEKRLAELRLQNTLAGLAAEEDGLKRSLARRETEFELYVVQVEVLESQRHQQVLAGLIEEAKAAEKLRKGEQRQIAEQEIANKRQQEDIRHAGEKNKLTDETEEHTRKQLQATTDVVRETISAQLRIREIADAQVITSLQFQASARVKSEEQAAREILKIRLDAIDREKERLEIELAATSSIRDPEEQLKVRAKLNLDLRVLKAERTAIEQDGAREVDDKRKQDLANIRHYAEELKAIEGQIVDIERGNAEAVLQLMEIHFASRRDIIRARLQFDLEGENSRHRQAEETIRNLEQENRESNRTQAEKDAEAAALNRLREAEEERHRLAMQEKREQTKRDLAQAGPGGAFLDGLNTGQLPTLQNGVQEFSDAAVLAFGAVGAAVNQLTRGFGELLHTWELTGSVGDHAFRRATAQILADISTQAAELAAMSLAYAALSTTAVGAILLGGTPAQFLVAAALFGAVAVGTGLAARKAAGNLFSQKTASAGAGGLSSSQGAASGQINTATLARNPGTPPRQEISVNVNVKQDPHSIVDVWVDDFTRGGRTREVSNNDGGVNG